MMIPDIQFSLICEDVRQEVSGHFIFLGVFGDVINVKQLPIRPFRLCIVNRWTCGQGDFRQKTVIICPDGHTPLIEGKEVAFRLESAGRMHTSLEQFLGVEFKEAGTYWIEVSLNGDLRMRYPFTVTVVPPPNRQQLKS